MKTRDFDYHLPLELIAQYPLPERSGSRLMKVNREDKSVTHCKFKELLNIVTEKDLLVFNDTKVIPARLVGHKTTGGKVECLVERILTGNRVLAHVRASKPPKVGTSLSLENAINVKVLSRQQDLFELQFDLDGGSNQSILSILQKYGAIPLPGYIQRIPETIDQERYQTIYAKQAGAVAAPTAGLHFDEPLMDSLIQKGVEMAYVTLHVGAGTFQPVRVETLSDHKMHREYIEVSREVCDSIDRCKKRNGRVIAVGTTVVRCLETAAQEGEVRAAQGETDLFIYPGYKFRCVDALITNFHLPKSSLLMLVSAFGGFEFIQRLYREAIEQQYRFFSYGDAMIIL